MVKNKFKIGHGINLGRTPWNKGKKHSIQTIEIFKKINKGINNPMYNHKHSEETKRKMSETRKERFRLGIIKPTYLNKKRLPSTIEKIKKSNNVTWARKEIRDKLCLQNNPAWKGGKSFEFYSTNFNNQFKESIRLRDNDSCVLCGGNKKLAIHHVDYDKLNSTEDNCISLCVVCHPKTNFNRKYWQTFFESMLSDRYGYCYIKLNEEVKL